LSDLEDPSFVDRGSTTWNEAGCKAAVMKKFDTDCAIEVAPEIICLDIAGGTGAPGPDYSGPTGGGLVTVGVGSGDFLLYGDGGMGGYGGASGEGGEGGI
jgi:hypothetical protein